MSAIFYHDKAQKKAAKSSKKAVEKKYGKPLHTKLLPAKGTFWVAEDYHQKFYLRRHNGGALLDMLGFTSEAELRDSPVATKLNAYVQNKGSLAQLQQEIDSFNLSSEARDYLLDFVQRMEATKQAA
ncbi:peptide-methionine (S)-S-oxide reductase [Balamuthia mandrillaris]